GFHSFTPNELVVVEALMKQCHSVTITLAVDNPNDTISELDLFHQTSETFHILKQIAYENYVMVDETIVMHPDNGRFKDRPYFAHLEQNFDVRPSPEFHGEVPIQIAEAVHPRAEVEGVAQEILRLVREEKYRFQDI
ncbi:helicase-exonuclease AddAB subunit AddB, partial [Staphylococcus sp. SIMBA_130]